MLTNFPKDQDFVGVIHIPNHIIGFQYGPRGYFIYDTLNSLKGLFEYYDPETFFSELKEHVLYDVGKIIKNEQQAGTCLHYSLRPLREINPSIPQPLELSPITQPLKEGWASWFDRKLSSCIHDLALTALQMTSAFSLNQEK
jgi:hypothetical protein